MSAFQNTNNPGSTPSFFGNTTGAQGQGGSGVNPPNIFGKSTASSSGDLFAGKTTIGAMPTGLFGNTTGGGTALSGANVFAAGSGGTSLFGNPPTTLSTSTGTNPSGASSTTLFGASANTGSSTTLSGGSTPFGSTKPSEQASSSTPKPPIPNFFSQSSTSTSTSTTAVPPLPGGIFGTTPKPTENTAAPTNSTSSLGGGGLFGGSLFGKKPEPAASASTPTPSTLFSLNATTSAAPPGGLFGNLGATKEKSQQAIPASDLFSGAKSASGDKKDASAAPTFSLGGSTALNEAQGNTAPSTTTVPTPSTLRGKTIEDIVNKWSAELDVHVREFNKFAGEVAVWDRALIENSNILAALYSHVLAAEREQNDIDQSLDHIEQQQRDLSSTLDAYEKSTQEMLGGQGGSLRALDTGPADTERDKNYTLATDLHGHLDDLSASLTQIIESVNSLSLPSSSGPKDVSSAGEEDPMTRITEILSSHLESLQWIDGAVREVENRASDVEKRVKESSRGAATLGVNGHRSRRFGLDS